MCWNGQGTMVYVDKQIHTCVSYEGVMTSGFFGGKKFS
jgi:hypothetical protein